MAIKPITNENAGYESNINRAEQTSIRSEKGNPKVVIKKPGGQNAGKGFSIGVKEIDTAVIKHIRNVMKPKVKEQNEIISVPVLSSVITISSSSVIVTPGVQRPVTSGRHSALE